MFRPAHPRVMNHRPRFNIQQNFQWRRPPVPRAFYGINNGFRPRPAQIIENGNLDHWCETCDRGFPSAKLLVDHKSQHQKCNIDGCQFVAHSKVITKHIQMQHSSGLFNKISKLNNPEEINKWREERKRNFPTRSNIEKKAAELKEKIDRGEKMGLKHSQRTRDTKQGNKRKLEPGFKHHNDKKDFKKKKIGKANNETEMKNKTSLKNTIKFLPPVEERKITAFSGIQELISSTEVEDVTEETDNNLIIEDDDQEKVIKNSQEATNSSEPVLCGALVSLMCQYGSSDEEENGSANTPKKLKDTYTIQNKSNDKGMGKENKEKVEVSKLSSDCSNTIIDDNDSGPEEVKVDKNIKDQDINPIEITKETKKKHHDKRENKHFINARRHKSKLPSTLLQKLLFKEVQHERNMVLQCIRYIVKNNYFEK